MTIETTTDQTGPDHPERAAAELCWLPADRLTPNPANPRRRLGSLDELVRSIRAHGVLEPLLVLPADTAGTHLILAGHRRYAAARTLEVTELPVLIRDLSPVEALQAMVADNVVRNDLSASEEIAAIDALLALDSGLTPAKLCRQIGKSQQWVRDRMTLAVLPASARDALDQGTLTLAAAVAAATLADLGPDHVAEICEQLIGGHWHEPARHVQRYRDDLARAAAVDASVATHTNRGEHVITGRDELPRHARSLRDLGFDATQSRAHRRESCHAVVITTTSWRTEPEITPTCLQPARHTTSSRDDRSDIVVDTPTRPVRAEANDTDSGAARRKSRLARLAAAREQFSGRRGPTTADLTVLALHTLIDQAGAEACKHAATILGIEPPDHAGWQQLLADATSANQLARLAGAVGCGIAETLAYHQSTGTVRAWFQLLVSHGWEPDDWTASRLNRTDRDVDADDSDADDLDIDIDEEGAVA